MKEKFNKIIPKEYALKLKEEFANHPEKWYGVITPNTVARGFAQTAFAN